MVQAWAADTVERKKVGDLIVYERNPNTHSDVQIEQLANSITEWGWTMPILIDEDNNILAGHGRLYAAQKLGLEEVPCVTAKGWSEPQKRAYIIADNKLAENSQWDEGLLNSELKAILDVDFDMSLLAFDKDLSFLDGYQPGLEPMAKTTEVTQANVDKAGQGMADQIVDISADKAAVATVVMCPKCGEEFKFSGV